MLVPWKKSYDKHRQCIKKQRHHFADKGLYSQATVFPVAMYGCEIWTIKKTEHQRINAFELLCWRRLLRVPLTARRSNQSILKEIKSWIFIGRTDAKVPILWSPDVKSWLVGKDLNAGNDWGQEEKGMTEDEMVRWHHGLNGHEFEQTLGDSRGWRNLACCSPWVAKSCSGPSDWTTAVGFLLLLLKKKKSLKIFWFNL